MPLSLANVSSLLFTHSPPLSERIVFVRRPVNVSTCVTQSIRCWPAALLLGIGIAQQKREQSSRIVRRYSFEAVAAPFIGPMRSMCTSSRRSLEVGVELSGNGVAGCLARTHELQMVEGIIRLLRLGTPDTSLETAMVRARPAWPRRACHSEYNSVVGMGPRARRAELNCQADPMRGIEPDFPEPSVMVARELSSRMLYPSFVREGPEIRFSSSPGTKRQEDNETLVSEPGSGRWRSAGPMPFMAVWDPSASVTLPEWVDTLVKCFGLLVMCDVAPVSRTQLSREETVRSADGLWWLLTSKGEIRSISGAELTCRAACAALPALLRRSSYCCLRSR